jgi:hypothetical protein
VSEDIAPLLACWVCVGEFVLGDGGNSTSKCSFVTPGLEVEFDGLNTSRDLMSQKVVASVLSTWAITCPHLNQSPQRSQPR